MDSFADFRISSWLENGLIKRIHDQFTGISIPVTTVMTGAAIVLASASTSNLDFGARLTGLVSQEAALTLQAQISQHPAMSYLRALGRQIDTRIARFDSLEIDDIDPELLAMAGAALSSRRTPERGHS